MGMYFYEKLIVPEIEIYKDLKDLSSSSLLYIHVIIYWTYLFTHLIHSAHTTDRTGTTTCKINLFPNI